MKNQSFFPIVILSMAFLSFFSSCKADGNKSNTSAESPGDSVVVDNNIDSTSLSSADMEDDHYDFSYQYAEDVEMSGGSSNTPAATEQKNTTAKTVTKKPKVKNMPVIYTVSQTDRPPLFSADCLNDKKPERCSSRALAEWARKSVVYPEADLAQGSDGLEYVTFVINKNGEVSSVSRVDSKIEACDGCSKAVLNAVLDMPNWQPAMLNGKPVNVVVTLPVRFKTL